MCALADREAFCLPLAFGGASDTALIGRMEKTGTVRSDPFPAIGCELAKKNLERIIVLLVV